MNGCDCDSDRYRRQIATTVIAVAESNSDVLDTRARARNSEDASRVPPGTLNLKLFSAYDRGAAAVTTIAFSAPVAAATTTTVDSNLAPLCCSFPMGSTSRYSSYNCLTSWDSYDRIPRYWHAVIFFSVEFCFFLCFVFLIFLVF